MADKPEETKDREGGGISSPTGQSHGSPPREATSTGSGDDDQHMKCSCGQHCGCNPCACTKSVVTTRVGRAYCKCGPGCTCPTCTS